MLLPVKQLRTSAKSRLLKQLVIEAHGSSRRSELPFRHNRRGNSMLARVLVHQRSDEKTLRKSQRRMYRRILVTCYGMLGDVTPVAAERSTVPANPLSTEDERQAALDRLSRTLSKIGLYDRNEMPAVMMSEPRIKHLRHFALFLPFSCNQRRQLGTTRCKAEGLEVIEQMTKTARYG